MSHGNLRKWLTEPDADYPQGSSISASGDLIECHMVHLPFRLNTLFFESEIYDPISAVSRELRIVLHIYFPPVQ